MVSFKDWCVQLFTERVKRFFFLGMSEMFMEALKDRKHFYELRTSNHYFCWWNMIHTVFVIEFPLAKSTNNAKSTTEKH